ncbi:hypothetical protein AF435_04465 [Listeria monocytogenes]|uniref:SpaA-like prealbumin fold domain-containing protein n=1 Tax=Listeria monocytogenes TaxID=1639 RepID=A0AAN2WG29_LISMN|nr:hypothetical protein [Listeria monocytogenes]EAC3367744.1 hypothetical protein [Listeria monocytogenes]EAC7084973.1 hypothetical protein [Listeria monocytogenes]EAC8541999.1 hypothetical protein [Listeria monocytogenes]EAC8548000.1 hypothetical protein [Listeria monocytogenes]
MKKIKKIINGCLLIVLLVFPLFTSVSQVKAAEGSFHKIGDWVSTWHSKLLNGTHWTEEGSNMMTIDGKTAFCVEHGIPLTTPGPGFEPSELSIPEKDRLALIAYYGYQLNPNSLNYTITQHIIWETLGNELLTTQVPNYQAEKQRILNQVDSHNTKPSFDNQTIELNVGDSVTLKDTTGVLDKYKVLANNSANLKVEKSGNTLKLTATADSKETGKLQYDIANKNDVGTTFVYHKEGQQRLAMFKLKTAGSFGLNIKVNLNGHIKVKKVDETTKKPLANTTIKFEYKDQTKAVITKADGLAELRDIKAGTKVKITEVQAADGFINKGLSQEVVIEPNRTIEIVLNNKPQMGQLKLKKLGKQPTGLTSVNSEYGFIQQIEYGQIPLENVTFDLKATEDIMVGGTKRHSKGDLVATVMTNKSGTVDNMPKLFLGKYVAVEKTAPSGFIIGETELPFEFTYGGQTVELVSTSLEVENEFQEVELLIHKDEQKIDEWKENEPMIENVPSEEKVFGLYNIENIKINDNLSVDANSLMGVIKTSEGVGRAQLNLQVGNYYVKELNSGSLHVLDDRQFSFTFDGNNIDEVIKINLFDEEDKPILNKLHFNHFSFIKENEKAILQENEGYTYDFSGNAKGAVFTLEDEEEKVIQTVSADENSIVSFENVPVGTFLLKEKEPSSVDYVVSDQTIKIVSTNEGITAYNEHGEELVLKDKNTEKESQKTEETDNSDLNANQRATSFTPVPVEEDPAENKESPEPKTVPKPLFKFKNSLKKSPVELSKIDVTTSDPLPETGIQILNEEGKIVVEGRTDKDGLFKFKSLPAGKYSFREFDAPKGYELDETPLPFEIKENNEIVKCEMTNKKIPETPQIEEPEPKEPKPENPKLKEKGFLPQTGEQQRNKLILVTGLLLVGFASGLAGYQMYKKNKSAK